MAKESPYEAALQPLLAQAQQGDGGAMRALLHAITPIASRFTRRKIMQTEEAEEVVQEILISVHKALHTYDPARSAMPWLAAIMHYRVQDRLRCYYRASNAPTLSLDEVENFLLTNVTEPPFAYEYLRKAMDAHLTGSQKAVINAIYGEDLTVKETSAKLEMSQSSVKVTAHRAYKKLRQVLLAEEAS